MAKVAEAFKTIIHRFGVGADVDESYDLSPHTFAGLVGAGFIVDAISPPTHEPQSVTISHGDDEA